MSRRVFGIATEVVLLALTAVSLSIPAVGSEKDAEYRAAVMKAIGGHMSAIVHIMKGEVAHRDHLGMHADALAVLSKIAPTLFPKGSEAPKSKALAKIWQEPKAFRERLDAFQAAALNFSTAVDKSDMTVTDPALNKLGKSCKGCHDDFKQE